MYGVVCVTFVVFFSSIVSSLDVESHLLSFFHRLLGHFQLCGGFLLRVSPHGAPRYAGLPPTDTPHTVQLQFLPLPFPHRQRGLWLFRSGARFLCVSFHLRTEDAPRGVPFKATPLQCFVGGLLGGRSDAARSRRHVDGGMLSLF